MMTLGEFRTANTKTRKDGSVRILASFRADYPGMTIEKAYDAYVQNVKEFERLSARIKAFESYLISIGAQVQNSNVSESRYYNWHGCTFRFSGHRYPTGSMTRYYLDNGNVIYTEIDFAADPQLIDTIKF